MIEFYNSIESELGESGKYRPISGFANKASEHCLRMAGTLHLFAENWQSELVDLSEMQSAIEVIHYYLKERLWLQNYGVEKRELANLERAKEWIQKTLQSDGNKEITLRQFLQYGPHSLRNSEVAEGVFQKLEQNGFMTRRPDSNSWQVPTEAERQTSNKKATSCHIW